MDKLTPEQRHKNMQAVKNKDSQIELLLRKELWNLGLRYRKNSKKVFGHPDIVFIGKKVAVFPVSENDWMDMGQLPELEKMRKKLYGE